MLKILARLQKNLVWSIPIAMTLGLGFGILYETGSLKRFIIPVTFIMVYPMMVTLNVRSVFKGRDHRLQLATQLINFVLVPALAFYTGKLFFGNGPEKYGLWAVGLFLIGVLPTSGMTISWTGFARGNKEAAIKMVVFGLVLGALAAPVYTKIFMGATVDVHMGHMFKQIALFVFVPLFAGLLTQYIGRKRYGEARWNQKIQPKFPPFSALGVTLIAFLAMSLKARSIIANPGDILTILGPLTVFYLVSYVLLSVAGRIFFRREDAVAMVFGVVMRDLSIALAIAMTAFGRQGYTIALLIALAYVVQIQSAAWYVRLVDWIFGPVPSSPGRKESGSPAVPDARVARFPSPRPASNEPPVPAFHRILYATDLSDPARHAARYACSLGSRYGAEVTVLHVIPDILELFSKEAGIDLAEHAGRREWADLNRAGIEKAKTAIVKRIRQTSRQVTREIPRCPLSEERLEVRVGTAADQILSLARGGGFDVIVMGTHGHGKMETSVIGSVAAEVIRRSDIPVMVVRLPPEGAVWSEDDRQIFRDRPREALDPTGS